MHRAKVGYRLESLRHGRANRTHTRDRRLDLSFI